MAVLNKAKGVDGKPHWLFWCPGCLRPHCLDSGWTKTGTEEEPTFSPSVLVTWDEGEEHTKKVCHSFIRGGKIQYLNDCTHKLAGKTVAMEEFKWEE